MSFNGLQLTLVYRLFHMQIMLLDSRNDYHTISTLILRNPTRGSRSTQYHQYLIFRMIPERVILEAFQVDML